MSKSQAVLIFNPNSGRGNGCRQANDFANRWQEKTGNPLRIHASNSLKDLRAVTKDHFSKKQMIIFMGGDGTLSESIQALAECRNFHPITIPVGFLPSGTGNSFLQDFGITNYETARDRLFSAIENNFTLAIDTGIISYNKYENTKTVAHGELAKRITFNIWGIGLIADITALAVKIKYLGPFSYTLCSLLKILSHKPFLIQAKINNEEKKDLVCHMITISNSQYTGGKITIAPQIRLNDGKLYLICIGHIRRFALLRLLPAVFKGAHVTHPHITTQFIQTMDLTHNQPLLMNVDGELITGFNPRIRIIPGFFKLYAKYNRHSD